MTQSLIPLQVPIYIWVAVIIIIVGLSAFVVHYLFFGSKKNLLRELKKSKLASLDSVKDNDYVLLHGIVKIEQPSIKAPLSGIACVIYEAKANAFKNDGETTVAMETKTMSFELDVAGISVYVDITNHTRISFALDELISMKKLDPQLPKENIDAFIKKHEIREYDLITKKERQLLFIESRLDLGTKVVVKGNAFWRENSEGKRQLSLSGSDTNKLLICNLPEILASNM